jgi:hypothetical protein
VRSAGRPANCDILDDVRAGRVNLFTCSKSLLIPTPLLRVPVRTVRGNGKCYPSSLDEHCFSPWIMASSALVLRSRSYRTSSHGSMRKSQRSGRLIDGFVDAPGVCTVALASLSQAIESCLKRRAIFTSTRYFATRRTGPWLFSTRRAGVGARQCRAGERSKVAPVCSFQRHVSGMPREDPERNRHSRPRDG